MEGPEGRQALQDEIRWLRELLGAVIREQEGEATFGLLEEVRALAKKRRAGEPGAEELLVERLAALDLGEVEPLVGGLSVFFDLANLAEDRQRVRVVRERERTGPGPESLDATVHALRERGLGPEDAQKLLDGTGIEFVFTAHPTEAKRRSVREKVRDLRSHLYALDGDDLLPRERDRLRDQVKADLTGLWGTDFVRFRRPSVLEELDRSLFFAGNLWEVVPELFRRIEEALAKAYPGHAFRVPPVLRFGTWIGGDRDGNPHVTTDVTRRALLRLRTEALSRHIEQARLCRRSLSLSARKAGVSDGLMAAIDAAVERSPSLTDRLSHLSRDEPYRRWLGVVEWRLRRALEADLLGSGPEGAYPGAGELVDDLRLMRQSLLDHGGGLLADVHLDDWIRQAEVFGFNLMRLDIRQESGWYHSVMAEILAHLGIHQEYGSLDEAARQTVLAESMPWEGAVDADGLSEEAQEALALFRLLASVCRSIGPQALGAHVVSMTRQPSDILVVLWLSRWAASQAELPGARLPMPLAPLFETIEDLAGAPATLDRLLGHPTYADHVETLGGPQMVMIGYSDSTKDGGYMAASWHLFDAQFRMQNAAEAHGLRLLFFHGRGGALGRGGGPAARHIRSLPAPSLQAGLRITEQGEVLSERYDDPRVAERHLEQMLSAVLDRAGRAPSIPDGGAADGSGLPSALLDLLARRSRKAYRELVDHPGFIRYFQEATPIQGVEDLPIGSRPARRGGERSLDTLRAIPWVFSWTQSRHMIPAWYGLGTALVACREDPERFQVLKEAYGSSGFFRATIDNAVLALAKADMGIARVHSRLVQDPVVRREIWGRIVTEYERTCRAALDLTGQEDLLDDVPWLKRSIQVRNPYVDPLNLIQVDLFRRLREAPSDSPEEKRTRELIRLTIQGIAGGLRTTG
jgi:phosphoenolpyruvate carboxylase